MDAAVTVAPELSSVPAAPALSRKLLPSGPLAVNVQVNTCVPPPPMSTVAPPAVTLAALEGCTVGGSGAATTPRASACPSFLTASDAVKDWPGATEPGTCNHVAAICAGACTRTGVQTTCIVTGSPEIGSVAVALAVSVTRPGEAACTWNWNVRVPPAGTSWGAGAGPVASAPCPETCSAAKASPTASTSPVFPTPTLRSKLCPALTVVGAGAGCAASAGGLTTSTPAEAVAASAPPVKPSCPVARSCSCCGPRDTAAI